MLVACDVGRIGEGSGCCEVGVQGVQHGSAEWKCSMTGEARVQAMEGVGERGAADTLACGATRDRACGASAGSGVAGAGAARRYA